MEKYRKILPGEIGEWDWSTVFAKSSLIKVRFLLFQRLEDRASTFTDDYISKGWLPGP